MLLLQQWGKENGGRSGVAPGPPALQASALLRELNGLEEMVVPLGYAPRSVAYRATALLLSYGTVELAEAERIELPRPIKVITVLSCLRQALRSGLRPERNARRRAVKTDKHASLANLR